MPIGRRCIFVALACALACGNKKSTSSDAPKVTAPPVPAPAPAGYDPGALGALHFDIAGGTPEARQDFDHGLLALHSFWYEEATKQFQRAIDADPTFAMAYWGLAMSHSKLLFGEDDLAAGQDALKRMPAPDKLPPHDQAWVVAALSLFHSADADVRTSRKAFLATMEQVHAQFPDDESTLFLALALLSTIQPGDPGEDQLRRRAGGLAAEVFAKNPKHPGAAHYMIHAYDTPELASLALPAAKQYATIAPAAYHALHMPAHTFARLGMWKEAVMSCQAAWDASVAWVHRDKLTPDHEDFHSLSWLIEIAFERGRRKDADRAMTMYGDAVKAGLARDKRSAYANQVASYLAHTGEWARVDDLLAPLQAPATDGSGSSMMCGPHMGMPSAAPPELFERRAVLGTRARAAAMRRDPASLAKLLDERDAVDAQLRPVLAASQPKELLDRADKVRVLLRTALTARAKGDDRALVTALRPLAADQEQEFTGEGVVAESLESEEIADAQLRSGAAKDALAQYRAVLAKHAGRASSLLGAARAATKLGDAATARDYYKQLLASWSDADDDLDALKEARHGAM